MSNLTLAVCLGMSGLSAAIMAGVAFRRAYQLAKPVHTLQYSELPVPMFGPSGCLRANATPWWDTAPDGGMRLNKDGEEDLEVLEAVVEFLKRTQGNKGAAPKAEPPADQD